jgi:peptide-methionine (S)-S-oxide reductase
MMTSQSKSLVLGGGCFWCLEAAYASLSGVSEVLPGYAGGQVADPSYREVCSGTTGHAEVVRVTYDPTRISLEQLMAVFWLVHDPTSLNRQGADVGTQYASVVFYEDEATKDGVIRSRDEAQRLLEKHITTRIEPLDRFYEAEPEHHDYYAKHPEAGYCQAVIEPKLASLRRHFGSLIAP